MGSRQKKSTSALGVAAYTEIRWGNDSLSGLLMDEAFKYDIAFSFLSQDETVAQQINDALQDRYRTFLYSERQKELAGTDGEETFKTVFSKEARIVAVLYRTKWGTTPWTRIEETAIRDRAHDEGYDFCTFIAMRRTRPGPPARREEHHHDLL